MNGNELPDPTATDAASARQNARSHVQQALLAVWTARGMSVVKQRWETFWAAWDAYSRACSQFPSARDQYRALLESDVVSDSELTECAAQFAIALRAVESSALAFDRIAREAATFALNECIALSAQAADGARLAALAVASTR